MKFIANVLVKIEVEADSEDFAKELLEERIDGLFLDIKGCNIEKGCYSLKSIGQRVMNIQKDNLRFVLKLKDSELYLNSSENGVNSYTNDINLAFVWKCNTNISELKIDEDMYEIVKI